MEIAELLDTYKNGRAVKRVESDRQYAELRGLGICGTIEGTSLGGATKRDGNHLMLSVRVKWEDGTESTLHHSSLEVI